LTDNGYIIKPDTYITRAEYLTVLLNTKPNLKVVSDKVKLFVDVKDNDWYKEVVDKASSNGILEGYPMEVSSLIIRLPGQKFLR